VVDSFTTLKNNQLKIAHRFFQRGSSGNRRETPTTTATASAELNSQFQTQPLDTPVIMVTGLAITLIQDVT